MSLKSKYLFIFFIFVILAIYLNLIVTSLSPVLPKPNQKPIFYSNQMRQDLKMTYIKALKKAKKNIHLVMFGLSDSNIINILNMKSQKNIKMKIFYDKRSSTENLNLKSDQVFQVKSKGLMHQKILVIDNSLVFLGSANFTISSLMMHDNLIIGFVSPKIAKFLSEKTPFNQGNISAKISGQKIEIWLLPDLKNKALSRIISLIDSAKSSIQLAMFTFTHPLLAESLINAKNRGVNVKVAIDYQTKGGASKKVIEKLNDEKITILFNRDIKLCHHKYLLIDNKTLICGSANWTKAAFKNNSDCFLILHNLDSKQKKFMKKLWKTIQLESSFLK
jgi:cardiolipin synthase A/B